jgi:hypothetical protein
MVVGAVKQECVPPKIAELIVTFRFTHATGFAPNTIRLWHLSGAVSGCLIRVAVARDPRQAMPLTGTWYGRAEASLGMSVEVIVRRADEAGTEANPWEFNLDDRTGPFLAWPMRRALRDRGFGWKFGSATTSPSATQCQLPQSCC